MMSPSLTKPPDKNDGPEEDRRRHPHERPEENLAHGDLDRGPLYFTFLAVQGSGQVFGPTIPSAV